MIRKKTESTKGESEKKGEGRGEERRRGGERVSEKKGHSKE
jgi:hypothetical protein